MPAPSRRTPCRKTSIDLVLALAGALLLSCVRADLESAKRLLKSGNFLAARRICAKVLERSPTAFEAHYCMGMSWSAEAMHRTRLGLAEPMDWYQAIYHMTVAANLSDSEEPRRTLAVLNFNLAASYKKNNRTDDALRRLEEALTYDSTLLKAANLLGAMYHQRGNYDRARRAYQRVVNIDSTYATGHFNLGALAWAVNDFGQADKHFALAERLEPHNPYFREWQQKAEERAELAD